MGEGTLLIGLAGLLLLVLGGELLVRGASALADRVGLSPLVVGLTLVALGTSAPELAVSSQAALTGRTDLAVGNVVGSNLFNVLGIVGGAAVLSPEGIRVSPAALRFDIPVTIAVSVACLPIFFSSWSISRWEGLILPGYYGAYVAFVLWARQAHVSLPAFNLVMWSFVLPATAAVLAASAYRSARS